MIGVLLVLLLAPLAAAAGAVWLYREGHRRKSGLFLAGSGLCCAGALTLGRAIYPMLITAFFFNGTIPGVADETLGKARHDLAGAGYHAVQVVRVKPDGLKPGLLWSPVHDDCNVVTQSPSADQQIDQRHAVTLKVDCGVSLPPNQADVPDVRATRVSSAQRELGKAGFHTVHLVRVRPIGLRSGFRWASVDDRCQVRRQAPHPDQQADQRRPVTLFLDCGIKLLPHHAVVPDVGFVDPDRARAQVMRAGFSHVELVGNNFSPDLCYIKRAQPAIGSAPPVDQSVTLYIDCF